MLFKSNQDRNEIPLDATLGICFMRRLSGMLTIVSSGAGIVCCTNLIKFGAQSGFSPGNLSCCSYSSIPTVNISGWLLLEAVGSKSAKKKKST